ncbi:MAG: ester cyclase [Saprospiraceae bacterium]|nr:ester cyclase [Saprospiraceae bacterium]
MKKVIYWALLTVFLVSSAQAQTSKHSSKKHLKMSIDANKEIALSLSKSIMKGDWAKVEDLLSDDFQYFGDGQAAIGKKEYIYFMKEILSKGFTNMDMHFNRRVGEADMVAVDYTNFMDNSGVYFGIPATGKRIASTGQFMRQIKNGQVVAEWQTTNTYGMMVQLGVIPPPKK